MCAIKCFPAGAEQGNEADHTSHLVSGSRLGKLYPHTRTRLHDVVLDQGYIEILCGIIRETPQDSRCPDQDSHTDSPEKRALILPSEPSFVVVSLICRRVVNSALVLDASHAYSISRSMNTKLKLVNCKANVHRNRTRKVKKKSKAIPVTGRGGLWGCKMLRIPHRLDNRLTDGGKVVSPTSRPLLYSPETLFLCFW
jgi:hypothetical protein